MRRERKEQRDAEFVAFVVDVGQRLHRSARMLTGEATNAEDLLQATLEKVYVKWTSVSGADDPVSYAMRMLHHTFLSDRRLRRNTERPTDGQAAVWRKADRGAEPAWGVGPDLLAALAALEPRDRALVVARYVEDRSVRETAELVGLSEQQVRTRASRALQRMRPLVADSSDTSMGEIR